MIVKGESLRASLCMAVLLSVVLLNGCAGARELMLGRQRRENDLERRWRCRQRPGGQGRSAGRRHRRRSPRAEDRRAPSADEHDLRAADETADHARRQARTRRQLDGLGRGRRRWKPAPDNKLYVIDLTTDPPKLIDTVQVGKQPSGLSINRAGNLCLIANRADNSISVLRIAGTKVTLVDTVAMGEQVAHVVFTPDGKRALAAKFPGNKIALLDVNGEKVTYNKQDLPVGLWPYNVDVTPDGKLALTADNGFAGAPMAMSTRSASSTSNRIRRASSTRSSSTRRPRDLRSARPASSRSRRCCAATTRDKKAFFYRPQRGDRAPEDRRQERVARPGHQRARIAGGCRLE